jgi:hypothetical protein
MSSTPSGLPRCCSRYANALLAVREMPYLHAAAREHALGRRGHHPAVLDIQHARTGDRLRLHVAAHERRQRLVAERLVEMVGDVLAEAARFQPGLRLAGDHDHRHVGLAGGLAHHPRQLQAVAVGQRQGGRDKVDRAAVQGVARVRKAAAGDHLDARQLAREHVADELAHQARAVHHHHPRGVADQVAKVGRLHGPQVSVGRVWRRKWPVTTPAPSQPSTVAPSSTAAVLRRSKPARAKLLP